LPIASCAGKQRPESAARRRSTEILKEAKKTGEVQLSVDHISADDPNWCSHRANGSIAGSCANSNIGVVTPRRFSPPWTAEELTEFACFVVTDASDSEAACRTEMKGQRVAAFSLN
jgi:hypothetical protein